MRRFNLFSAAVIEALWRGEAKQLEYYKPLNWLKVLCGAFSLRTIEAFNSRTVTRNTSCWSWKIAMHIGIVLVHNYNSLLIY